jgi:hypothetical protein
MCIIMSEKCGGLHSVKWYKENSRVFVYSPISNFKNAEVQSLPALYILPHMYKVKFTNLQIRGTIIVYLFTKILR